MKIKSAWVSRKDRYTTIIRFFTPSVNPNQMGEQITIEIPNRVAENILEQLKDQKKHWRYDG